MFIQIPPDDLYPNDTAEEYIRRGEAEEGNLFLFMYHKDFDIIAKIAHKALNNNSHTLKGFGYMQFIL